MKKISSLKGIAILSKNEQKEIKGSALNLPYCKGNQCCVTIPSGLEICDYGYCQDYGRCIWA